MGGDDAMYIKLTFSINPFFIVSPRHVRLVQAKNAPDTIGPKS